MFMYDIRRLTPAPSVNQISKKLIERNREHLNTVSGEDWLLILTENDGLLDRNFLALQRIAAIQLYKMVYSDRPSTT
jgi:hypothetical protein